MLETVRGCNPPDWLVGAGVIRNLVWDHLHQYQTPTSPWLGKRAPTEGDASIPSPLHSSPAPTRSDASEDAAQGIQKKPTPARWGGEERTPERPRTCALSPPGAR